MRKHLLRHFSYKTPIHSKVLILGSGDAGTAAIKMLKAYSPLEMWNIRIIDPSATYWYQSLQTAIGAGMLPARLINFSNKFMIPRGVIRTQARVMELDPDSNLVRCDNEQAYSYDVLIVATGIELRVDLVKGLAEALEDPNCPVGSNYMPKYAEKYSRLRAAFEGGTALFTQPSGFIKCGGAPQKIMYLACDDWIRRKIFHYPQFLTGTPKYFVNEFYEQALYEVAGRYKAQIDLNSDLIEVRPKERIAVFKNLKGGDPLERHFDILHVTPPQRSPAFIASSKLAGPAGFVDVDMYTLQSRKYPNVFSLGDAAELPTSRTASTINEESYILARNVLSYMRGKPLTEKYDGYTACPVFVGKHKLMLCEFGYDGKVMPTFFKDQRKPRYLFYLLKLFVIPPVYVLFGPNAIRLIRHGFLSARGRFRRAFELLPSVQKNAPSK